MNYAPHPEGIRKITMRIKLNANPGDGVNMDPYDTPFANKDYNERYRLGEDCTSLFRIRYRTCYDYIRNGYSWTGLAHDDGKEMDLDEFNSRGGDRLIDMSAFYLIAKEPPATGPDNPLFSDAYEPRRYYDFNMKFENGQRNRTTKGLRIFSNF